MSVCASHIWSLESHPSRLNKEAIILTIAEEGCDEFFEGCRLALDPMVTFGVKQVPEKKDEDGPGFSWDSFVVLASSLRNRNLTGHDARDAIAEAITQATQKEWNGWYRRILIKDLRCGTSEKTINKVVEYCLDLQHLLWKLRLQNYHHLPINVRHPDDLQPH